jgi:hypothetical protein
MLARLGLALVFVIAAACAGGSPATAPATAGAASSAPVGGDVIDSAAITAAVDALQARGSWQFDVRYISAGPDGGFERTLTGTERPPEDAVDALHEQPGGMQFRYVRIGDDIWFDAGTGTFTQVQAGDAGDVIEQYEPYYLEGLADSAQSQNYEFELVGPETVSNIATSHYRLSQSDRDNIVENLDGITADQWGGDVWIATDGGYLVGLNWGPQTTETAQIPIGFSYLVTAVDCECPIEPPA